MRDNKIRWFGYGKKSNSNEIVKKTREIRVGRNRGRGRLKNKGMEVTWEDMRAC